MLQSVLTFKAFPYKYFKTPTVCGQWILIPYIILFYNRRPQYLMSFQESFYRFFKYIDVDFAFEFKADRQMIGNTTFQLVNKPKTFLAIGQRSGGGSWHACSQKFLRLFEGLQGQVTI